MHSPSQHPPRQTGEGASEPGELGFSVCEPCRVCVCVLPDLCAAFDTVSHDMDPNDLGRGLAARGTGRALVLLPSTRGLFFAACSRESGWSSGSGASPERPGCYSPAPPDFRYNLRSRERLQPALPGFTQALPMPAQMGSNTVTLTTAFPKQGHSTREVNHIMERAT
ncbi:hypothetical protein UY3_03330 [Chelonia mydas]|uniref:Uncharacterized protein n=1 Tax=Chelonia mydas TaxID=8469 RepID=M7C4Q8_CHEMY|nr:hypothetical protein UY3_03330 [Chelonia mydas]